MFTRNQLIIRADLPFRNRKEAPYETEFSPIFDRTGQQRVYQAGELESLRVARRLIIRSARKMQKIVCVTTKQV